MKSNKELAEEKKAEKKKFVEWPEISMYYYPTSQPEHMLMILWQHWDSSSNI